MGQRRRDTDRDHVPSCMSQEGLQHREGTERIDLECAPPIFQACVLQQAVVGQVSRVTDHHIDLPELGRDGGENGRNGCDVTASRLLHNQRHAPPAHNMPISILARGGN